MENEFKIELTQEQLNEKLKSSKFWYLCRQAERNAIYVVDLCEYLFGKEKAEEMFETYENIEDIVNFLLKPENLVKQQSQIKKENLQEDFSPEITE